MSGLRQVVVVYCLKSGKTLKSDPQIMSEEVEKSFVKDYFVTVANPNSLLSFVAGGSLHVIAAGSVDYMVLDTTEHDEDSE